MSVIDNICPDDCPHLDRSAGRCNKFGAKLVQRAYSDMYIRDKVCQRMAEEELGDRGGQIPAMNVLKMDPDPVYALTQAFDGAEEARLDPPIMLFYQVPTEGNLRSTTLYTWQDVMESYAKVQISEWTLPGGIPFEMMLLAHLFKNTGLMKG